MARTRNRLTALGVSRIDREGRYADGGNLYLRVNDKLNKSWVFRWTRHGNTTEIGLGSLQDASLANARKLAGEYRAMLAADKNPMIEREKIRNQSRTFGQVVKDFLSDNQHTWNNEKTRWQWEQTLTKAVKRLHNIPVADIGTREVLLVLKPIWIKTPGTAVKVRMRLERLLDYADSHELRDGENPARWKGHLENLLPKRPSSNANHLPAMPYDELSGFMNDLRGVDTLAACALQLTILTACRTSEVLNATWDEFDFENAVWTIPASRMKAGREHRVPLTGAVVELLRPLHEVRTSEHVFPGIKNGKPLSNMAMAMALRRLGRDDLTVHGFWSTFRDWARDKTSFPREVAEAALAHTTGNQVELPYRRSDALEKRRRLMDAWADYCGGGKAKGKVVKLNAG